MGAGGALRPTPSLINWEERQYAPGHRSLNAVSAYRSLLNTFHDSKAAAKAAPLARTGEATQQPVRAEAEPACKAREHRGGCKKHEYKRKHSEEQSGLETEELRRRTAPTAATASDTATRDVDAAGGRRKAL